MSNNILLLGAGFSRNWGGWLADEVFEYLIGCDEIKNDSKIKDKLWKTKDNGGFENALFELEKENEVKFKILEKTVYRMFSDMDKGFKEISHFRVKNNILESFLTKFDAIFTLNQDILLERFYLNNNVQLCSNNKWMGFQLAGIKLPCSAASLHNEIAINDLSFSISNEYVIEKRLQPIFKLHGSFNLRDENNPNLMIIGGGKKEKIDSIPVLKWYSEQLDNYLLKPDTKLMVIGYSFKDPHINDILLKNIDNISMFIVDPNGVDVLSNLNDLDKKIAGYKDTEDQLKFKKCLVGASRRGLISIFNEDVIEKAKLERFLI